MNYKRFLFLATLFVISLIYSRFLVSVSMFGIFVLAIYEFRKNSTLSLKGFFSNTTYSGLLLVFLVVVLSGLNSTDTAQWLQQVKLKLPFLILPFAFYALAPIDRKAHTWIHLTFCITVISSTFWVLATFFQDYEAISDSIGKGKSIPAPIDHIHYSIMVSYAAISCFLLSIWSKTSKARLGLFISGVYLFAFSHFLSVRTGIVLSYAGIGVILVWFVLKYKKYALGFGIAAIMMALPFVAYHTIKPFKKKVGYMLYDLKKFKSGEGNHYSDSERLMSFGAAMALIKEKPFLGHGIGDLKSEMVEKHKTLYGSKEKYISPHNQYLYILASMGIIGAFIFFISLISPLLFSNEKNIFLTVIFVMLLLSFLVEDTIQRAVITAFYLFFILLNFSLKEEILDDSPSIPK